MHSSPTPAASRLLTLGEFERLPEADEDLELSRGRLVREPQPGARHGAIVMGLLRRLDEFVRESGSGRVVVEAGFLLSDEPPTVRRPDLAFVSYDSWPAGPLPDGLWPFAPDLAVEVVSPSNTAAELHEKNLQYLATGSRLVWVVHPGTETVEVWRPGEDVRVLADVECLDGGDVVPGFLLPVRELFEV